MLEQTSTVRWEPHPAGWSFLIWYEVQVSQQNLLTSDFTSADLVVQKNAERPPLTLAGAQPDMQTSLPK